MSEFMEYKGYLGSVEELEREFCAAVDHYLAVCENLGKTPQTPTNSPGLVSLLAV